jgi:hypothetical protein
LQISLLSRTFANPNVKECAAFPIRENFTKFKRKNTSGEKYKKLKCFGSFDVLMGSSSLRMTSSTSKGYNGTIRLVVVSNGLLTVVNRMVSVI